MTKIENSPKAYGFIAGAAVLILGLIANASCAHSAPPRAPAIWARYDAAVQITATCLSGGWYGSGVIIDDTHLMTAGHVAETQPGDGCVFVAENDEGKTWLVRPVVVLNSDDIDLATMEIVSPIEKFPTFDIRLGPPPEVGSTVCTSTAYPRREYKCGGVMRYKVQPGDIRIDMVVEPGNSGSALYDSQGRLVGIVVHLYKCRNGQMCTAAATSVWSHVGHLIK